ncbi:hypothetical protein [Paraflavitalea sp. CAU 1676]|uniref:hypothetical protein n=1 Tax=Paraflavitalea sp. CAU 1676 TaxID=3032598 RepID=UPI0023DCE1FB|nr:hypothetical protein [Paraflavitalea sp. CAU 1676]MDF2192000.1 hypothetical protein [Paraflavitalea sp. CAU 1676]
MRSIQLYKSRRRLHLGEMLLVFCWVFLLNARLGMAQEPPVKGFEVIARQPFAAWQQDNALSAAVTNIIVRKVVEGGRFLYGITSNGKEVAIPALSSITVPLQSNNIWVYGDSAYRHSAADIYAAVYDRSGVLMQSLGWLGANPYSVAVSEAGAFVFAGNTVKADVPVYEVVLFDEKGSKRWSARLPNAAPTEVYVSADHQYVGVTLFSAADMKMKTLVLNGNGRLMHTIPVSLDGLAFVPGDKMVVCNGKTWSLYDMRAGFTRVFSGVLPGSPVGQYPVISDQSGQRFYIFSQGAADGQLSVQAYDIASGVLQARSTFSGQGHRLPYRQLEFMPDGTLQVRTDTEVLSLKMK